MDGSGNGSRPLGRPSKFTPERKERLLESIRGGLSKEAASKLVKITPQCLYTWLHRGEEEGEGVFFEFYELVKEAEASCEMALVSVVKDIAMGQFPQKKTITRFRDGRVVKEVVMAAPQWTAAAWLLERKWYDRWGKRERYEVEHIIREEAKKLAERTGLNEEDIVREAQRLLSEGGA